jgi:hypothetical protein
MAVAPVRKGADVRIALRRRRHQAEPRRAGKAIRDESSWRGGES